MSRKRKKDREVSEVIPPKQKEEHENATTNDESCLDVANIENRIKTLTKEIDGLKQEIEDLETGKLDYIVPDLYKEMLRQTGKLPATITQEVSAHQSPLTTAIPTKANTQLQPTQPQTPTPRRRGRPRKQRPLQTVEVLQEPPSQQHGTTESDLTLTGNACETEDDDDDGESSACNADVERHIKRLQSKMAGVIKYAARKDTGFFDHNVTNEEAPDYSNIIAQEVNLLLIQKAVDAGRYLWPNCKSPGEAAALFTRDLMLMFANAYMYNRPGSDVWEFTSEMKRGCLKHLEESHLWPIQPSAPLKRKSSTEGKETPRKRTKTDKK